MGERHSLTMKLTAREANIVWGLLDGALDAGQCEGGLSAEETEAASKVADALLRIALKAQEASHDE
jgi:hypothetical protein